MYLRPCGPRAHPVLVYQRRVGKYPRNLCFFLRIVCLPRNNPAGANQNRITLNFARPAKKSPDSHRVDEMIRTFSMISESYGNFHIRVFSFIKTILYNLQFLLLA